jgi:small GTP-binding protein
VDNVAAKKVSTGIPKLDRFLKGSIPVGKSLIYLSHPGVEGNVFGRQTVYHNLKNGIKCVYVVSSCIPDQITDHFKSFGWDEKYLDQLIVIDAFSSLYGGKSTEEYVKYMVDPTNIDNMKFLIHQAIKDLPSMSLIMFDSLSTIMDLCGEKETLATVQEWNKWAVKYDQILVYNFTEWPYSESTLHSIRHELFNCVVKVAGIKERIIFGQYFCLLKADWSEFETKSLLFRVLRPGGIFVYIPKILVTGPHNAGKTSFVKALSNRSVHVDRSGTTVALDYGHVEYKGFCADIFGTPGQNRFDSLLEMLACDAMGIFLVVDSTEHKEHFVRAKQMLEKTMGCGFPYLICANKQDLPEAKSPEEIRCECNLPDDVPIVPTVATEQKGVFEAFEMLVEKITGSKGDNGCKGGK